MADQNCKIASDLHTTRYIEIFRIVDFKLEIKLQKFKMADPIWWTEIVKYNLICMKLGI